MIIHRAIPGTFTKTLSNCYLVGYERDDDIRFIFHQRVLLGSSQFHSLEDEIMIETIWGTELSDELDAIFVRNADY